jgi:hypothetical protein
MAACRAREWAARKASPVSARPICSRFVVLLAPQLLRPEHLLQADFRHQFSQGGLEKRVEVLLELQPLVHDLLLDHGLKTGGQVEVSRLQSVAGIWEKILVAHFNPPFLSFSI